MITQTISSAAVRAAPPPIAPATAAASAVRRAVCPLCGRSFVLKKIGHTYCTRRCLFAAKRLERRRSQLVGAFGPGTWALEDCPFSEGAARLEGRRAPDPYWGF